LRIFHPPRQEGAFLSDDTALIFANGEQKNLDSVRSMLQAGDFLVAVDGGIRHLKRLGLAPTLLIGDLDSVSEEEVAEARRSGTRVVQYPIHKDETDLELALQEVLRAGYKEVRILGALGGRLDMILANISLLMLPELVGINVRLEDGSDEVFLIYPDEKGKKVFGNIGDRISLLPWGGPAMGIHTRDLYYPLNGETLYPERTRGISNLMTSSSAHVKLKSGLLICIHTCSSGR